jgi:hypothetical protein
MFFKKIFIFFKKINFWRITFFEKIFPKLFNVFKKVCLKRILQNFFILILKRLSENISPKLFLFCFLNFSFLISFENFQKIVLKIFYLEFCKNIFNVISSFSLSFFSLCSGTQTAIKRGKKELEGVCAHVCGPKSRPDGGFRTGARKLESPDSIWVDQFQMIYNMQQYCPLLPLPKSIVIPTSHSTRTSTPHYTSNASPTLSSGVRTSLFIHHLPIC